jgi:hypothetical protein
MLQSQRCIGDRIVRATSRIFTTALRWQIVRLRLLIAVCPNRRRIEFNTGWSARRIGEIKLTGATPPTMEASRHRMLTDHTARMQ